MSTHKNPFPTKAVISLGGAKMQNLRTLPTEAINRTADLTTSYLNDGVGQILTISGPYGSGKTHLIHSAMEEVRKSAANADDKLRFVQVYVKAEDPTFVSLYKQIIHEIGPDYLREVNTRFLGVIALKEFEKKGEHNKQLLDLVPTDKKAEM